MEYATVYIVLAALFGIFMAWGIGANDVANAMATSVGSKALTIKQAIFVAAIFEFLGAVLAGGDGTSTIRKGMIDTASLVDQPDTLIFGMLAALLAAGVWLLVASRKGWPVSTTEPWNPSGTWRCAPACNPSCSRSPANWWSTTSPTMAKTTSWWSTWPQAASWTGWEPVHESPTACFCLLEDTETSGTAPLSRCPTSPGPERLHNSASRMVLPSLHCRCGREIEDRCESGTVPQR